MTKLQKTLLAFSLVLSLTSASTTAYFVSKTHKIFLQFDAVNQEVDKLKGLLKNSTEKLDKKISSAEEKLKNVEKELKKFQEAKDDLPF